ncbi:MAG: hypothetical protein D6746_17105 [Bacteroidetes bacterium]|nr:MAG: hypothetical protein D6746_17105 [Bacteroidota bacterium]
MLRQGTPTRDLPRRDADVCPNQRSEAMNGKNVMLALMMAGLALGTTACATAQPGVYHHRGADRVIVVKERPGPDRVIVVKKRPPRVRREVQGHRPSHRHVWIPGHWAWERGRFVWRSGYWAVPPRPGAVWVAAHWVPRHDGWVFVAGYWR